MNLTKSIIKITGSALVLIMLTPKILITLIRYYALRIFCGDDNALLDVTDIMRIGGVLLVCWVGVRFWKLY